MAGDWKDTTLREQAEERGYQLASEADPLDSITAADQNKPVLGLFHEGNFPVRWQGPKATHNGASEPAVKCENYPERTSSVPKLDEAVKSALDFAKKDGETLVITTADHAHTSQITTAGTTTPGPTRTLTTADGTDMTVNYATADGGASQGHTGTQIRIAAYGPGAADVVGLTDQTDMHDTIADGLGLDRDAEIPGDPGDDANGNDDSSGSDDANSSGGNPTAERAMPPPAAGSKDPDRPAAGAGCFRAPEWRSVPRSFSAAPRSSAPPPWSAWPSAASTSTSEELNSWVRAGFRCRSDPGDHSPADAGRSQRAFGIGCSHPHIHMIE